MHIAAGRPGISMNNGAAAVEIATTVKTIHRVWSKMPALAIWTSTSRTGPATCVYDSVTNVLLAEHHSSAAMPRWVQRSGILRSVNAALSAPSTATIAQAYAYGKPGVSYPSGRSAST
jgi:hypothetical protein